MALDRDEKREFKALKAKKKAGELDKAERKRFKALKALKKGDAAAAEGGSAKRQKTEDVGETKEEAPAKKEKKAKKAKKGGKAAGGSGGGASSAEVQAFREAAQIVVEDPQGDEHTPIQTFEAAAPLFPAEVLDACCKGFKAPSPVQAQSWPIVMAGRDIVSIAKTGSGKTLGFVLPGIAHILEAIKDGGRGKTRALVVAPTRELAQQSAVVFEQAGAAVRLTGTCIYGGVPKVRNKPASESERE
jgi:ATP-dependent RNA helicase DBP3